MKKVDLIRISKIIADLVIRNMENGSSYEKAKEQAFNRMNLEYPGVLRIWLNSYIGQDLA